MFEQETVFILGAGASWHYGYPTSEDLVKRVKEKAGNLIHFLSTSLENNFIPMPHWGIYLPEFIIQEIPVAERQGQISNTTIAKVFETISKECKTLIEKLDIIDPPVIDYFLRDNQDVAKIGKLLIALVIIECELQPVNKNRKPEDRIEAKDNWLRFIINQLLAEPTKLTEKQSKNDGKYHHLMENKIHFITFNYDTSLEDKLYAALSNTQIVDKKLCDEFFVTENRFIHIYGKINQEIGIEKRTETKITNDFGKTSFSGLYHFIDRLNSNGRQTSRDDLTNIKALLDRAYDASKGIETIGGNKHENSTVQSMADEAIKLIKKATVVYILGYGFDERNSNLLKFKELLEPQHKKTVMFTNWENKELINKRAGGTVQRTV